MKAITLAAVLCLLSSSAFSIGRPHNVFATHKAVSERTYVKKGGLPPQSIFKNVAQQTQNGAEETRQAVSAMSRIVSFFLKKLQ